MGNVVRSKNMNSLVDREASSMNEYRPDLGSEPFSRAEELITKGTARQSVLRKRVALPG
jgi:hypothetical protein